MRRFFKASLFVIIFLCCFFNIYATLFNQDIINEIEALKKEINLLKEEIAKMKSDSYWKEEESSITAFSLDSISNSALLDVINQANAYRETLIMPSDYVQVFQDTYMQMNEDYAFSITKEEASSLLSSHALQYEVSYNDAISDVDLYFRLLRYRMGHYDVLGGDAVFNQAKETVLNNLKQFKNKTVKISDLTTYLVNALSFVDDCHFAINYRNVFYEKSSKNIYKTFNSNLIFEKDEKGYFINENNKKAYYESCSENRASIVPFLSDSGEIKYSLILYCSIDSTPGSSTVYLNNGKKITRNVNWTGDKTGNLSKNLVYSETENIAYVNLSGASDNYEQELRNIAQKAQKKNVVIIDLRSNGGTHAYNFINDFLDVPSEVSEVTFSRVGMTNCNIENGKEYNYLNSISSSGYIAESNAFTVVLVDNSTGCAPEEFMQYCRMIENCIVIGTSTKGHLDGGTMTWGTYPVELTLPKTGIVVNISTCLALYDNFTSYVGKGFKPDIYVSKTADAPTLAIKMLYNYGLISEDECMQIIEHLSEEATNEKYRHSSDINEAIKGFYNSKITVKCEKCGGTCFVAQGNSIYKCKTCGKNYYTYDNYGTNSFCDCMITGFWTADLPLHSDFSFAYHLGDNSPTLFYGSSLDYRRTMSWGDSIKYFYMDFTTNSITSNMKMILKGFTDKTLTFDVTYLGTEYKNVVFTLREP